MPGRPLVLVPGGAGYAGGRIVEHLASSGWHVRVVSRTRTQWPGHASPHIEVVTIEGQPSARLDDCLSSATAVVMLAGANELQSQTDPHGAVEATAGRCMAWLDSARRSRVEKFIYFSTVHAYGWPGSVALAENAPARPVHAYASTHLAAEVFVQAAHRAGWTRGLIFRLSNSFGAPAWPGIDRWSLLLNDLARQAVLNRKLVLKTDGMQARDFIPLSDVCAAVEWALGRATVDDEAALFNLGSGRSTTVFDMTQRLADRCESVLGFRPPIERPPADPGRAAGAFLVDPGLLARSGFQASADWDAELDGLLRFCRDSEALLPRSLE